MNENTENSEAKQSSYNPNEWDARILQLKSYVHFADMKFEGDNSYRAASYYDMIQVHSVDLKDAEKRTAVLKCGYAKMQELLKPMKLDSPDDIFQSQHIILAFRKLNNEGDRRRVLDFWGKHNPKNDLFFVTMVNVGIDGDLDKVEERINALFCNENYLLYRTLEYNEMIIFSQTESFKKHSDLVMRLNYEVAEHQQAKIIDTITICGFQKELQEFAIFKGEQEKLDFQLRFGVSDYKAVNDLLARCGVQEESVRWVLGRNDVAVFLKDSNLSTLRRIYRTYKDDEIDRTNNKENKEPVRFLLTAELFISNATSEDAKIFNRNGWKGGERDVVKATEKMLVTQMKKTRDDIQSFSNVVGIELSALCLRMLNDLRMQIISLQRNQLADDLAICLLPQFQSCFDYLNHMFDRLRPLLMSDDRQLYHLFNHVKFRRLLNAFYFSMASLINSTVHGSRQFIQVPHCGVTAFEMPPKVMACYTIIAEKIIDMLREDTVTVYGVMLSPKMVNELDVESYTALNEDKPNQMLSISISEQMLYDPARTVAILGHEMAHFVGEAVRMRAVRRNRLMRYYIFGLIRELVDIYRDLLPFTRENIPYDISYDTLLGRIDAVSCELADELFPYESQDTIEQYRDSLFEQIESLPRRILLHAERRFQIFNRVFFPETEADEPIFCNSINCFVPFASDRSMLRVFAKRLYNEAIDKYRAKMELIYSHNKLRETFDDVTGYVFYEAYADVCMALLYEMDLPTYEDIFLHSLREHAKSWKYNDGNIADKAMLTRYCAVLGVFQSRGTWRKNDTISIDDYQIEWEKIIHNASSHLDDVMGYANEMKLDGLLLVQATEYLKCCAKKWDELMLQKSDKLEQLRSWYKIIVCGNPYEFLEIVRQMEKDLYTSISNS